MRDAVSDRAIRALLVRRAHTSCILTPIPWGVYFLYQVFVLVRSAKICIVSCSVLLPNTFFVRVSEQAIVMGDFIARTSDKGSVYSTPGSSTFLLFTFSYFDRIETENHFQL